MKPPNYVPPPPICWPGSGNGAMQPKTGQSPSFPPFGRPAPAAQLHRERPGRIAPPKPPAPKPPAPAILQKARAPAVTDIDGFFRALQPFITQEEFPDDTFAEDEDETMALEPEPIIQAFGPTGAIQASRRGRAGNNTLPATGTRRDTYIKPQGIKSKPTKARTWLQHSFGNRTYNYETHPDDDNRLIRYQGPLAYVKGGRSATAKVRSKRKSDQSGHLIAHSLGGDPKFTLGYIAMKAKINSAGGHWGQMERYVRKRVQAKGAKAYMACRLQYPTTSAVYRPENIKVNVYFNRSPYKVTFTIDLD